MTATYRALRAALAAAAEQAAGWTLHLTLRSGARGEFAFYSAGDHQMQVAPFPVRTSGYYLPYHEIVTATVDIEGRLTPIWPDNGKVGAAVFIIGRLAAYGFESAPMGGGCRAWSRQLTDGRHILITDAGGTCMPDPFDWMIGCYRDADCEQEGARYWYSYDGEAMDAALIAALSSEPLMAPRPLFEGIAGAAEALANAGAS